RRPLPWLASSAVLVGAALALLARLDRAGGPILAASVAIFAFAQPTRYYWSILALLAFLGGSAATRGPWRANVAGLLAISAIAEAVAAWNEFAPFLYNVAFSFLLLAFFAALLALLHLRRIDGRGQPATAWATAVATTATLVA